MNRVEETWIATALRCLAVGVLVALVFAGLAAMMDSTRPDRLALAPDAGERFSQGG